MVWVNPPNRSKYIVIARLRNIHSRQLSKFDDRRSKMFNYHRSCHGSKTIKDTAELRGGQFSARCASHLNERRAPGDAPLNANAACSCD
jgi:hypothetical protein